MDAPPAFTSEKEYAAASDYNLPSLTTNTQTLFDDWESLLGPPSSQNSSFVEDLCDEFFEANPALQLNPSIPACAAAAPESDCELQPCVYGYSNLTVPPPSLLFYNADALYPIQSDVSALRKPPPASSFSPSSNEFDADPKGIQISRAEPFAFSFSHLEVKHNDMLLPYHHALHATPQLTNPNTSTLQSPMKPRRPPMLDVSASPAPCGAMGHGGIASPAYKQSNVFSPAAAASLQSAVMEMSTASAPDWASPLPEIESLSGRITIPASPTPSVNKAPSTKRIRSCGGATSGVSIKVKTTKLDLHDSFRWKKYGEKNIIGRKFTRSYFRCNEKSQCGCKVVKRAQICDDGEHIIFTYLGGRHNHP